MSTGGDGLAHNAQWDCAKGSDFFKLQMLLVADVLWLAGILQEMHDLPGGTKCIVQVCLARRFACFRQTMPLVIAGILPRPDTCSWPKRLAKQRQKRRVAFDFIFTEPRASSLGRGSPLPLFPHHDGIEAKAIPFISPPDAMKSSFAACQGFISPADLLKLNII